MAGSKSRHTECGLLGGSEGCIWAYGRRAAQFVWRGAALTRASRPNALALWHVWPKRDEKQAAPGNDPAFGCSISVSDGGTGSTHSAG